jgi:hypothetical protein
MSQARTIDKSQATPGQTATGRAIESDGSRTATSDPIRDLVMPKSLPRRSEARTAADSDRAAVARTAMPRSLRPNPAPATMPAGIVLISSMQFLMAGLIIVVVLLLSPVRLGVSGRMLQGLTTAWPALLLLMAGTGMLLRWTWGWRLTTSIAWFMVGNPVCEFVLGLMRGELAVTGLGVGVFAVALGAVAYLNTAKQMAVFGIGDPESSGRNRPLPAMAGLSAAAVRTLALALA